MALQQYQWQIKPNRLYIVRKMNGLISDEQMQPNIMINGCVDVYGLNSADEIPTIIDELCLPPVNHNISGFATFEVIPTYLYCRGEALEIILTGIQPLKDLGPLRDIGYIENKDLLNTITVSKDPELTNILEENDLLQG
jgi:hypothetical protein